MYYESINAITKEPKGAGKASGFLQLDWVPASPERVTNTGAKVSKALSTYSRLHKVNKTLDY
ncbi:hypothetical protein FRB91_010382 [Serendipita sp. 411]|nr:hypothetical protein FRB91_010382 [Serendipita sp. 411]